MGMNDNRKWIITIDTIVSVIIISSYGMILGTFYIDIAFTTYFLFLNIALSFVGIGLLIRSKDQLINIAVFFAILTIVHYLFYWGTVKLVDELIVISVVCYAAIIGNIQLSEKNRKLLVIGAVICTVFLLFQFNKPQYWTYQGWLQYIYVNTNTAATVALNLFAIIVCAFLSNRVFWQKLVLALMSVGLIVILYSTHSRSAFLAGIILVLLLILNKYRLIKYKFIETLVLFPVISIPFVTILMTYIIPQDAVLLDKTLYSGREELWIDAVRTNVDNILHLRNAYTTNLNVALRLPYLSGLLGAILFFILLRRIVVRIQKNTNRELINPASIAFCGLLIAQSFESTLISGSFSICFLSISVLGFANCWMDRDPVSKL